MKLVFGARHLKFASLVLKPQSGPAGVSKLMAATVHCRFRAAAISQSTMYHFALLIHKKLFRSGELNPNISPNCLWKLLGRHLI
jgi:hypothetical protein